MSVNSNVQANELHQEVLDESVLHDLDSLLEGWQETATEKNVVISDLVANYLETKTDGDTLRIPETGRLRRVTYEQQKRVRSIEINRIIHRIASEEISRTEKKGTEESVAQAIGKALYEYSIVQKRNEGKTLGEAIAQKIDLYKYYNMDRERRDEAILHAIDDHEIRVLRLQHRATDDMRNAVVAALENSEYAKNRTLVRDSAAYLRKQLPVELSMNHPNESAGRYRSLSSELNRLQGQIMGKL